MEYILVASFDIDRGSIMEHQYPAPIGGDENMLAELMLPDQAHMRTQDWTMFFLHKDNAEDEEIRRENLEKRKAERLERMKARESEGVNEEDEDLEDTDGTLEDEDLRSVAGPPLVYVLNLVTTKQDNTVRRCVYPSIECWKLSTDYCAEVPYVRQWLFAQDIPFYTYTK